jgi:hypothetical protein
VLMLLQNSLKFLHSTEQVMISKTYTMDSYKIPPLKLSEVLLSKT